VRRYRVRVHGAIDPARLETLARGITVDGVKYGPIRAQLDRQQGANAWITLSLQEGRNREVRRVLEHLGYPVTRLIRLAYGPFQLGHLPPGAIEEVPRKVLQEQLGHAPPKPTAAPVRRRREIASRRSS
jgi:23S rRNA pseudouridine2605 synthase